MGKMDFGLGLNCGAAPFFLEPVDVKSLGLGAICNFSKVMGLPWFDMGHKGPINLLEPKVTWCTNQFNIQQLYALPTLYLCVL